MKFTTIYRNGKPQNFFIKTDRPGKEVESMNVRETMKELAQYLRMQEELAETVEGLKDQIKAYMAENGLETLASDEHKATYKAVSSSRIDTTAFKKAFPSIAEQFTKTTVATRFTFN